MNTVVIGVGSNIDPHLHIHAAASRLAEDHDLLKQSTLKVTKPLGNPNQPDFLNGAFLVRTPLGPDAFRACLKEIEMQLGREAGSDPDGPRPIDLDIVVWNGTIIDDDYYRRDFLKSAVQDVLAGSAIRLKGDSR